MKALSVNDLGRSGVGKFFELGFAAATCQKPEEFRRILSDIKEFFPIESVVCGFGKVEHGTSISAFCRMEEVPSVKILQVATDDNYPRQFLDYYIKEKVLCRDGQFYKCLKTQKPQLWIDVYDRDAHPFNERTKRGFDPRYVEAAQDFHLPFVLRQITVDLEQTVGNVSLAFRNRNAAYQYGELLESIAPYLHLALLRVFGHADKRLSPSESIFSISHREREVLKWLVDGKNSWEIGQLLKISERTVKFHIGNLMREFGAINRHQLVAYACGRQHGNNITTI